MDPLIEHRIKLGKILKKIKTFNEYCRELNLLYREADAICDSIIKLELLKNPRSKRVPFYRNPKERPRYISRRLLQLKEKRLAS